MTGMTADNNYFQTKESRWKNAWLLPCIIASIFFGKLVAESGMPVLLLLVVFPLVIGFLVLVFHKPKAGLIAFILYCFFMPFLNRHLPNIQFGLLVDALLVLTWLAVLFYQQPRFRWRQLNNGL